MKNKTPVVLYMLAALLLADTAVSALLLRKYEKDFSFTIIAVASFLALAFIISAFVNSRNFIRRFSRMNKQLEYAASEYMNTLPAPVAVVDADGNVLWFNSSFSVLIADGQNVYGLHISNTASVDVDAVKNNGHDLCLVNSRTYRVFGETYVKNDNQLTTLYFHDETDYFSLKKLADETRQSVVIIKIDNYDDLMQNAKESLKARTSVETEQLIENLMSGTNGFIKKVSSDTFYAVLENRHLNEIIDGKFKILDDARKITIGEKKCLTFSIGVGQGASSLAESEKYARDCLDMALGRGGDQAAVKTDGGYQFFGGVSKGVERRSRAKIRTIANTLQEHIENSNHVFIMGHRFGDLDSIGSACGLAGAVRLIGRHAYVVADSKNNLAPQLISMVNSKVSEALFITPSDALDAITENDLLIIVDTHNPACIESTELYNNASNVIVIDHHRKVINYIDNALIFHHEPNASSASEMVAELIQYFRFSDNIFSNDCFNNAFADAMLAGIMLDTKNFTVGTGVRTFEAAAFLRRLGADTVNVRQLFATSLDSYKRRTQIVTSARMHRHCAVAVVDFKADDIRVVASQAADELLGVSDVKASFVLFKTNDTVNISARSLDAVNVQLIMEELGGGGHKNMAAAQLADSSVQDAVKLLIKAIDNHLAD